jgi:hypothetical protein
LNALHKYSSQREGFFYILFSFNYFVDVASQAPTTISRQSCQGIGCEKLDLKTK